MAPHVPIVMVLPSEAKTGIFATCVMAKVFGIRRSALMRWQMSFQIFLMNE